MVPKWNEFDQFQIVCRSLATGALLDNGPPWLVQRVHPKDVQYRII